MTVKRRPVLPKRRWRVRLTFLYDTHIEVDAENTEMAFHRADAVYREGGHDEVFHSRLDATAKEIP